MIPSHSLVCLTVSQLWRNIRSKWSWYKSLWLRMSCRLCLCSWKRREAGWEISVPGSAIRRLARRLAGGWRGWPQTVLCVMCQLSSMAKYNDSMCMYVLCQCVSSMDILLSRKISNSPCCCGVFIFPFSHFSFILFCCCSIAFSGTVHYHFEYSLSRLTILHILGVRCHLHFVSWADTFRAQWLHIVAVLMGRYIQVLYALQALSHLHSLMWLMEMTTFTVIQWLHLFIVGRPLIWAFSDWGGLVPSLMHFICWCVSLMLGCSVWSVVVPGDTIVIIRFGRCVATFLTDSNTDIASSCIVPHFWLREAVKKLSVFSLCDYIVLTCLCIICCDSSLLTIDSVLRPSYPQYSEWLRLMLMECILLFIDILKLPDGVLMEISNYLLIVGILWWKSRWKN